MAQPAAKNVNQRALPIYSDPPWTKAALTRKTKAALCCMTTARGINMVKGALKPAYVERLYDWGMLPSNNGNFANSQKHASDSEAEAEIDPLIDQTFAATDSDTDLFDLDAGLTTEIADTLNISNSNNRNQIEAMNQDNEIEAMNNGPHLNEIEAMNQDNESEEKEIIESAENAENANNMDLAEGDVAEGEIIEIDDDEDQDADLDVPDHDEEQHDAIGLPIDDEAAAAKELRRFKTMLQGKMINGSTQDCLVSNGITNETLLIHIEQRHIDFMGLSIGQSIALKLLIGRIRRSMASFVSSTSSNTPSITSSSASLEHQLHDPFAQNGTSSASAISPSAPSAVSPSSAVSSAPSATAIHHHRARNLHCLRRRVNPALNRSPAAPATPVSTPLSVRTANRWRIRSHGPAPSLEQKRRCRDHVIDIIINGTVSTNIQTVRKRVDDRTKNGQSAFVRYWFNPDKNEFENSPIRMGHSAAHMLCDLGLLEIKNEKYVKDKVWTGSLRRCTVSNAWNGGTVYHRKKLVRYMAAFRYVDWINYMKKTNDYFNCRKLGLVGKGPPVWNLSLDEVIAAEGIVGLAGNGDNDGDNAQNGDIAQNAQNDNAQNGDNDDDEAQNADDDDHMNHNNNNGR